MKFCANCDNMLYLNIVQDEDSLVEDKLMYECKNCNFKKESDKNDNSCIFKIDYNIDKIKKNSFINPFIYEDITLPRAEGIKCPNEGKCPKTKPEIIYIKYDNENMKFIYICLDCYKGGVEPHIW
tara:strand:+ start:57 stop:431 length:375 start_codon:yes stop_codon:yes gene_type:complete